MFIFAVRREGALEGLALILHFPLTGSQAGRHHDPKKVVHSSRAHSGVISLCCQQESASIGATLVV